MGTRKSFPHTSSVNAILEMTMTNTKTGAVGINQGHRKLCSLNRLSVLQVICYLWLLCNIEIMLNCCHCVTQSQRSEFIYSLLG